MKTYIHRPTYGDRRESFFSRLHSNDSSFGLTQFIMLRFSPAADYLSFIQFKSLFVVKGAVSNYVDADKKIKRNIKRGWWYVK